MPSRRRRIARLEIDGCADSRIAGNAGELMGDRRGSPEIFAPVDLAKAIRRGIDNAPAVIDVITSQDAVSSDAKKGLGFVPDYQLLTAWDDAERKRHALA